MRVLIETSEVEEPIITIHCKEPNAEILKLQQTIQEVLLKKPKISFYQDGKEYYFPIDQILFFETDGNTVYAHTSDHLYKVKERLYELEQLLPTSFLRISKSTILNTHHVYSIERNLTSYGLVEFYKSHKKVYVSRFYYKTLKQKLEERRSL